MKEQKYSDQLLTRYLFGDLSEPETERLDELSFTDDELAAHLQVLETDLIDAYVRGELSGSMLESFTSRYLSSPVRRRKVALARGFQDFLNQPDRTGWSTEQVASAEPVAAERVAPQGFLERFFRIPGPAFQWGVAAALLLLMAVGGWLTYENLRLRSGIDDAQAKRQELQKREQELQAELAGQQALASDKEQELARLRQQLAQLEQESTRQNATAQPPERAAVPIVVSLTLTPQTRSGSQPATLALPADADSVSLQLDLEPNDFTVYRAELKSQPGNTIVWRSVKLRAKAKGDGKAITVTLRPALLKAQRYVLEVYGDSPTGASEIIGSYPFSVVKP